MHAYEFTRQRQWDFEIESLFSIHKLSPAMSKLDFLKSFPSIWNDGDGRRVCHGKFVRLGQAAQDAVVALVDPDEVWWIRGSLPNGYELRTALYSTTAYLCYSIDVFAVNTAATWWPIAIKLAFFYAS
jgi:hypothetical protein